MPPEMLGGVESRWNAFEQLLAEHISGMDVADYFVLAVPGTEYFVQGLRMESDRGGHAIALEAVAPIERGGPADLTPVQQLELIRLGWAQPDEHDPDVSSNFVSMWITDLPAPRLAEGDAEEAAALLVATLRGPFDVSAPETVEADYGTFADD